MDSCRYRWRAVGGGTDGLSDPGEPGRRVRAELVKRPALPAGGVGERQDARADVEPFRVLFSARAQIFVCFSLPFTFVLYGWK